MDEAGFAGLAKVDEEKRAFLKKLAIGSAYVVPAIATFSLDSIRSKAHAQSVYTEPVVVTLRAVPAAAAGDYLYGQPPTPFASADQYYWVITYDRPMDPAFSGAKICKTEVIDYSCQTALPGQNPTPAPTDACGTCSLAWEWSADRTQERAAVPMVDAGFPYTQPQRLSLWLNHPSCAANTLYRDTHGTLLPPFVGIADLCSPTA